MNMFSCWVNRCMCILYAVYIYVILDFGTVVYEAADPLLCVNVCIIEVVVDFSLLQNVWFFLSSLFSFSFCLLWCTMHVIVHHTCNYEAVDPLLGVNVYSGAYSNTCAIHTVSACKCKEAGDVTI